MLIRVKVGTVELPYRVKNYEFAPDAEVPESLGVGLLKTYPAVFEKAVGKPAMEKYVFKKTFQVNEIQKVLDQLTEEGRLDVYEYAKKLLADDPEKGSKKDPEKGSKKDKKE
jgi:hypothetical protein